MSAPTVERTRTSKRTTTRRGGRDGSLVETPRDTGGAVGRAYARRAGRKQRIGTEPTDASAGRSQFVLLIMVLLGVGLVTSLWLSTTAAADSYRLDAARAAARDLSERSESLNREIATMQSAPALAQAAAAQGMVPAVDVARLVVGTKGVDVVGTPMAAVATARPVPLAPPLPTVTAPGVAPVAAPAPAAPRAPAEQTGGQPGVVPAPEQDSEQAVQTQAEQEQAAQQQATAPQRQTQQLVATQPQRRQRQATQPQTAARGIQPGIAGVPMVANGGTGR